MENLQNSMTEEEKQVLQEFKAEIVNKVKEYFPKDYRKSREWTELSLEEQFDVAVRHSAFKKVLEEFVLCLYHHVHDVQSNYEMALLTQ